MAGDGVRRHGDRERLRSRLPSGVGKWAPMQKSGACQSTECRGERWGGVLGRER